MIILRSNVGKSKQIQLKLRGNRRIIKIFSDSVRLIRTKFFEYKYDRKTSVLKQIDINDPILLILGPVPI